MLFSRRSASDKKAGRSALFSLQVGESRLGGGSHLFVAVIGQTFERSDRSRCRGEAQSFDCDRAQARGLSAEQTSARLGKFDRSEEHTSELQSRPHLVCRLLLETKIVRARTPAASNRT